VIYSNYKQSNCKLIEKNSSHFHDERSHSQVEKKLFTPVCFLFTLTYSTIKHYQIFQYHSIYKDRYIHVVRAFVSVFFVSWTKRRSPLISIVGVFTSFARGMQMCVPSLSSAKKSHDVVHRRPVGAVSCTSSARPRYPILARLSRRKSVSDSTHSCRNNSRDAHRLVSSRPSARGCCCSRSSRIYPFNTPLAASLPSFLSFDIETYVTYERSERLESVLHATVYICIS